MTLFALALAVLLPAPTSDGGKRWITPSRGNVIAAITMFFLSLLIATLACRESIPGLLFKTLIFGLFAFFVAETTGWMASSIHHHIAETLAK